MEKYEASCKSIGNTPKDARQVTQQVASLQQSVETLHIAIEALHSDLYIALVTTSPEVADNSKRDRELVPLAEQLYKLEVGVNDATDLLRNIKDRLEL